MLNCERGETAFSDERRLDAVERLIPLGEEAGLPMPHLAMAFAISHPGVTSALLGARTMEQLDDLTAGMKLDGNAIGGLLLEIFGSDVTSAEAG
jgi:aryl-alcohol dehydrogenase-like predicted oxidoreductase